MSVEASPLAARSHLLPRSPSAVFAEFEKRGWTDGLPVIPPTPDLVREMLEATDLPPDHVVAHLRPTMRAATVERIAINSVMAGCLPEHLPAVIAALEAIGDPHFYLLPMGSNPATPLTVVNGPARQRLGVSPGHNTLGVGHRANVAIGRAVHLVIQNVGMGGAHEVPDLTTIGTPVKHGLCMAENEEESPWEPLHVERGWPREVGTATVFNVNGSVNLYDSNSRDGKVLLERLGRSLIVPCVNNYLYATMPLVVIGPEHAAKLARDGYSKADVKEALWRWARIPRKQLSAEIQEYLLNQSKRTRPFTRGYLHITDEPDGVGIVVAGGQGPHSVFLPTLGFNARDATTRQIRFKGEAAVAPPPGAAS